MDILVIGGGGREHAIIMKLAESKRTEKLYCTPGNGGISRDAEIVNIGVMDKENMVKFAKAEPDADENEENYTRAYYFVENTKLISEECNEGKEDITIETKIGE